MGGDAAADGGWKDSPPTLENDNAPVDWTGAWNTCFGAEQNRGAGLPAECC